ncbi:MAG: RNA degradosome polyphosphate kinase [Actinobacteria bacterium]|nr:RNA degradosome polyphosphate kinase [Actinomycetota bacterium]
MDISSPISLLPSADSRYINRELSWLDFNGRVLSLAEDPATPLLERAKFLAIFGRNLDEFFQVRVSGLKEQASAGVGVATPEGMTPREQLAGIRERVGALVERAGSLLTEEVLPALEKAGIRIVDWDELGEGDHAELDRVFQDRMFPVITPLSVDPSHPFPYISSLSLNLAAVVRDPMTGQRRFARVKVPPLLERFVPLADGRRLVPIEQVLAAHLDSLFPGMEIVSYHVFRVTRDADMDVEEDEAEDLLAAIETVLVRRRRAASPVRLEVDGSITDEVRGLLLRELELEPDDVYEVRSLLDLSSLASLAALDRPGLKDEPFTPVTQKRLAGEASDVFTVLRGGDVLVHHPYDSFSTSVEAFVEQAAGDRDVLAIKQTLYRTSADSPIVRALIRAAESGKQVVALVELKARFDEQANINWARALEQAGVHVVYGVAGLKTHAKTCLVVRRENAGIRRYAHIGTGNYNPRTAGLYEDLGLLTADPEIGADLTDLFNLLTGYSRQRDYRKILVAPISMRPRILELIDREAQAADGSITLKMNSLVDADMIDALYEASQAGTQVDLIVRGICCLRPGLPGLSERINVRSLVGRYLEHSRIFRFGSTGRGFDHYFGSADLMPRNLDRRVEAMTPVTDPTLATRLDEILEVSLADDVLSWELASDGRWHKVATVRDVNAQQRLQASAAERAHGQR